MKSQNFINTRPVLNPHSAGASQQRLHVMAACNDAAIAYCLCSQEAYLEAQDMSCGLITKVILLCYLAATKTKPICKK